MLIEIEAGFLALGKIDVKAHTVFFDDNGTFRRPTPQQTVLQFQPFQPTNAAFGAEIDAFRPQQIDKDFRYQLAPPRQPQMR